MYMGYVEFVRQHCAATGVGLHEGLFNSVPRFFFILFFICVVPLNSPGSRAHTSSELVRRSQAPSAPTSRPASRTRPLTGGHEQRDQQQNPSSRPGSTPTSTSMLDKQIARANTNPSTRIGQMGLALLGAISESERFVDE